MSMFFEDLEVGAKRRFGRYEVTAEEVRAFAERYDPQPFHLSDEGAVGTPFDRMSASGWHTGSMAMAMMVADWQSIAGGQDASLGGMGMDEVRWLMPVYPGDVLHVETELVEKIESRSRTDRGIIKTLVTVYNQHDDKVMLFRPTTMVRRRNRTG